MKTLYLIDGHSQFFRAFHAIRTPMTSPVTKEPTNATFGFVSMLLKMLREEKPDYLVVVIDAAGDRGTFRSEIYPEYKANREEPPELFGPQVERCVSLLRAIGAPVIGVPGVEADDAIAAIVDRVLESGEEVRVRIVSKDKDLQQLLCEGRVEMYDVHTGEKLDCVRLMEEKGITPRQVVDVLTLTGDTVDNVPGVEGVGPKTASALIGQYGSLENLLAHADEVRGKRGEALRAAAGRLEISKQLVTLRRDLPVEFDLESAAVERLRLEELAPILRELGFNRFQDELKALIAARAGGEGAAEPARTGGALAREREAGGLFAGDFAPSLFETAVRPCADGDYRAITTREELAALVERMRTAEVISIDTETTGLSPLLSRLCGVSVSLEAGAGFYIPICSPAPETHLDRETVLGMLRPVLEDEGRPKTGQNLKFDMLVLRAAGVALRGIAHDSMVASYVVDASRSSHSMDALAQALLGYTCIPISDLIGTGRGQRTFDSVPLDVATVYAAEDADIALRLSEVLGSQIKAMGLESLFNDVEMPLVEVLAELEWNGIAVDPAELDRQAERLRERIEELRRRIVDAAPRAFNLDSPRQLAEVLFNSPDDVEAPGLGIKSLKKTKTGRSTDIEVLERLAADPKVGTEVPRLIVEYRQLTKLVSTYLVALKEAINPRTGRIHASFNQTVAATGRLSSSDPNLQNIPIRTEIGRDIRRAFVAPEGRMLVSADYSQIELRMLAHLSRDAALSEAFERGEDIHRAVAAQIAGVAPAEVTRQQRDAAKMVNFGIVYGVTPFGLARRLGVEEREAAKIIADYKARFPGITTFLQECVEQARRYGYVETILRRRRPIPSVDARNPQERALNERIAINSVVQGSAADLIKLAMIDLHRLLKTAERGEAGDQAIPGVPAAAGLASARMLLQIHDELLFEADERDAEAVRRVVCERMESAMRLTVPLKVESAVSRSWFEGK